MDKKACIIAAGVFGGNRCLLKNRDRNYVPELTVYHEIRNGLEVLYVKDEVTGWLEGMNEKGIGIVNAALMVGHDEAEKKLVKTVGKKSSDGARILKALEQPTLNEAIESAKTYLGGIKGHTFLSTPRRTVALEMTSKHDPVTRKLDQADIHVRTNHGIEYPDAGYQEGEDYISSISRREQAKEFLADVSKPERLAPTVYEHRDGDAEDPNNMVRDNPKTGMRTTSQLVLDLTQKKAMLYLIPGKVRYKGYHIDFPDDYKPKLQFELYKYTDLDGDGDYDVVRKKDRLKKEAMIQRVAQRYASCDVLGHGLQDIVDHGTGILYHGSTRSFQKFDTRYVRHNLVDKYYGGGIFLTPKKHVAEQYAGATRNASLPSSIIQDLSSIHPNAALLLQALVDEGGGAWDKLFAIATKHYPDETPAEALELWLGLDPNLILDISEHVEGSRSARQTEETLFDLWGKTSLSVPSYIFDTIQQVGLNPEAYQPKVYTVLVSGLEKVLVTKSRSAAKKAHANGYDAVIFCGMDLVGNVPEVAVFDPGRVRILRREVVE